MPALIAALMPAAIQWTARPVAKAAVSAITSHCREVTHSHRLRWIVERTIAWLNRCRTLAKDWDA